jgi:hypothetical protein
MKAVNITAQQKPDSQNARDSGNTPQWRCKNWPNTDRSDTVESEASRLAWRQMGKMNSSDSAVKALRQNVTSNRAADSSCRETTPAVDHNSVTTTINTTACVWLKLREEDMCLL